MRFLTTGELNPFVVPYIYFGLEENVSRVVGKTHQLPRAN